MQRRLGNPYIQRMHDTCTYARNIIGALAREGLVSPAASHPIPPESQLPRTCTQRYNIYKTLLLYYQSSASLSAQPMLLREFLARSNQDSSETPQASYGSPRCSLNLVRLFCLSLPLSFFRIIFLAAINLPPSSHTVLYYTPGSSAVVLQFPRCQTPDDRLPGMQLLLYSRSRFDGGLLCRRGWGCSVTCTTTVIQEYTAKRRTCMPAQSVFHTISVITSTWYL